MNFNEFCDKICDRLYDPNFPYEDQCTGYKRLREMVINQIEPASEEETKRWETEPTSEELLSIPDIKYMRFLHPNLRKYVIENWGYIKDLEV